MGDLQAREMVEAGGKVVALRWHLQNNHYPPVPLSMIPVCLEAIDHANCGEWDSLLTLPKGVSFRGSPKAPVSAVIEQHHLDSFLLEVESNGY
jgi:hypothetical protein